MTTADVTWLLSGDRRLPSAEELLALSADLVKQGRPDLAATACDAAFGLAPENAALREVRDKLLRSLRIEEHGIVFRYVPAGPFRMGAEGGDPDERPVHTVELGAFWITEVPVTWSAYHALMGWPPPPDGMPPEEPKGKSKKGEFDRERFALASDHKIRRQYCESETARAVDWHAHTPDLQWERGGQKVEARELFGSVPRNDPARPWTYDQKPMVAVAWEQAVALGERLSSSRVTYRLPSEAEWEKAARGGLVGKAYPWGDEPPTSERCDVGRFEAFSIRPPRSLPPNGYGLFGMSGGVREWTLDEYDALSYASPDGRTKTGKRRAARQRVARGGSWADCAWAARVSFRMGVRPEAHSDPTIGFRLCRVENP